MTLKEGIHKLPILCLKVNGRLHLGSWAKALAYQLTKIGRGYTPHNTHMSSEEAEDLLQTISPDTFSSALCKNSIIKPAKYDLLVVVPIYKAEQFLQACLQSVLTQKTKYSYHIVAVNDGSPDGCGEILKRYEDNEKVSVITQENKGHSGARNRALEVIDAKYVTFLDSDDLLAPNAIDRLMDAAYKHDADVVEGSYKRRTVEGKLFYGEYRDQEGEARREQISGYPCMKVFRAELFEHVRFPEGYWFEDTVVGMLLLPLARSFATIKDDVYYYTWNTNSISFASKTQPKNIEGVYITRALLKDAKQCGVLGSEPEYMYHFFLQQVRKNWYRSLALGADVELAMFIISCDLRKEFFATLHSCTNPRLSRLERALMHRNYNLFLKACFEDF